VGDGQLVCRTQCEKIECYLVFITISCYQACLIIIVLNLISDAFFFLESESLLTQNRSFSLLNV
jgi:hypothetical protein